MDAICKRVCAKKMSLRIEILVHRREIKCSETFRLILSEKTWFPTKTIYTSFPLVMWKCCSSPHKFGKANKVGNIVWFTRSTKFPAIFFKLGPWPAVKHRACVLRFYALNFLVFMAANFKMVFDFYGAVHFAKKQGMRNFLSPKCLTLSLWGRRRRMATEAVSALKLSHVDSPSVLPCL